MDLLPYFQSLEATFIGTKVRESLWMFPVIECVHLLALGLLGGAAFVLDLRLLGFGLRDQTPADLERKLHPWLRASIAMLILTGVPMFLSEAIKCYYSPPFWYKIGGLILAIIFTFTVRRRVASRAADKAPVTALASIALWMGVAFAGRWIAFY